MAGRAGAQAVGCGGERGGVQDRKRRPRVFLGKCFELESDAGIS